MEGHSLEIHCWNCQTKFKAEAVSCKCIARYCRPQCQETDKKIHADECEPMIEVLDIWKKRNRADSDLKNVSKLVEVPAEKKAELYQFVQLHIDIFREKDPEQKERLNRKKYTLDLEGLDRELGYWQVALMSHMLTPQAVETLNKNLPFMTDYANEIRAILKGKLTPDKVAEMKKCLNSFKAHKEQNLLAWKQFRHSIGEEVVSGPREQVAK